ncbi:hypothetical protein LRS03_03240 [Rhizobacter sp. J219]|uniref:hypothetical protein n=1 Tax=Rhizobacter sp. J219 TaxID=2898430 RepID=UPI002150C7DB|nr:hypothetical protein [Rhizobacter sp. J219]MCR5881926.1 hypothetical protein [Rhizobacter sp. J219]
MKALRSGPVGARQWLRASAAAAMVMVAGVAQAAMVEYSATSLGGDVWRYDYRLVNDGPALAFDEFSVYFDAAGVTNLSVAASPAGWSSLVVQPDPQLPDVGYFDALHLSGLVPAGSTLGGFSVLFTAGQGFVPGAQRFELLLSEPFTTVYSGMTEAAVSAVPLPAPALLLLAGLGLGATLRRRRAAEGEFA